MAIILDKPAHISGARHLVELLGSVELSDQEYFENGHLVRLLYSGPKADDFLPQLVKSFHVFGVYGYNQITLSGDLAKSFLLTDPSENKQEIQLIYPSVSIHLPEGVLPNVEEKPPGMWVSDVLLSHSLFHPGNVTFHLFSTSREGRILRSSVNAKTHAQLGNGYGFNTVNLAIRIVTNLNLWLQSHKLVHKPRPQWRKKKKDQNRVWPKVWVTGKEVVLSDELRSLAEDFALSETPRARSGWKLRMQHLVRGHWRNQVCGPRNQERKMIWVEPFLRGPGGLVAGSHNYVVMS